MGLYILSESPWGKLFHRGADGYPEYGMSGVGNGGAGH